jgi:outer membrane lipoprotein-sorting protein
VKELVIVAIGVFVPALAAAESAEERGLAIARKIDKANAGFVGEQWQMKMVLVDARGDSTTRKLTGEVREMQEDGDQTIMTFESPADVRGTRLLTWTHKRGDDDQWMYAPAARRTARIRARNRSGAFVGSEFAYEDFNSQEVESYSYKFLGDSRVDGRDVWVLEQIPTKSKSGYSKMVCAYDKEYMNPVRIKYYDRKGEELKVAKFDGYKKYRGGLWRPSRVQMVNKQTGKITTLEWSNRQVGKQIPAEKFSKEYLDD